ncbi:MAG: hypothetical protein ACI9W6_001143 [Motiliproteus sp.]|jgi:hypothetical protein
MDVGMPLLSGTDNGQWLDPAGLFQAEFHRLRRGFGCHSDGAIAVSSLSKSYKITLIIGLNTEGACLQAIF